MEIRPQILFGSVMHKRLSPKVNRFAYGIYYIALPLSDIASFSDGWRFGIDRPGILSFYRRDHGNRKDEDLEPWIRSILEKQGVQTADGEILLVTLPRVLGYVFNPVSFWLCHDKAGKLRAVMCEVNNTFGESHSYLCAHENGAVIGDNDWFAAKKLFHVSPFLKREGLYKFRFAVNNGKFGAWIDLHDAENNKHLLTALTGLFEPASRSKARKAFWGYPLITLKAVTLIHAQAFKLLLKGIKYVPKPPQMEIKFSKSGPVDCNALTKE